MSLCGKLAAWALVCLGCAAAAAQQSDQLLAARVLGPQWKKMVHTAGMVFSGTVLGVEASPAQEQPLPAIQIKLRVDHAITGVEVGQFLTIREWAGAWSMHRPMRAGEHVLLLLYPLSRLGFTSPVSGARGQIALDASGTKLAARFKEHMSWDTQRAEIVSVLQVERAIRNARRE